MKTTTKKTSTKSSFVSDQIMKFLTKVNAKKNKTFRAQDLRDFVAKTVESAPGTADRVLRKLRQLGKVDYEVTDRRKSVYSLTSVSA